MLYTIKVSEHGHSIFNILLVVLSAILVVVALVFLIRKNLQLANYTYLAYVLRSHSLVLSTTLSAFKMRFHFLQTLTSVWERSLVPKVQLIFGIVLNVIFLAIVFYKIWRQQKELTESQEEEELA